MLYFVITYSVEEVGKQLVCNFMTAEYGASLPEVWLRIIKEHEDDKTFLNPALINVVEVEKSEWDNWKNLLNN